MEKSNLDLRTLAILGAVVWGASKVFGILGRDVLPPVPPARDDSSPATLTAAQVATMADQIEAAIYGSGLFSLPWEDEAQVVDLCQMCQTTRDVILLVNAYGTRGTWLDKKTLPQAIRAYLSDADISAINADFQAKGIQFAF